MDEIKNYQIELANFFRSPVNSVNFGVNYAVNPKFENNLITLDDKLQEEIKQQKDIDNQLSKDIRLKYLLDSDRDQNTTDIYNNNYTDKTKKETLNSNENNNKYNENDNENNDKKSVKSIKSFNDENNYDQDNITSFNNEEDTIKKEMFSDVNKLIKENEVNLDTASPKIIHRYNKIFTDNMKQQKKSLLACRLQMSKIAKSGKDSLRLSKIFKKKLKLLNVEKKDEENNDTNKHIKRENVDEEDNEFETGNSLYRILFMVSDLYWNENIELPTEELYLVFHFLGKYFRIKLTNIYTNIKYIDVDFYKLFYIITDQQKGFFDYVEKNKVNTSI